MALIMDRFFIEHDTQALNHSINLIVLVQISEDL